MLHRHAIIFMDTMAAIGMRDGTDKDALLP